MTATASPSRPPGTAPPLSRAGRARRRRRPPEVSATVQSAPARPEKSASAFRTIGEVADDLDLPAHVLRFWESKFPQLKPLKRGGGRRYYRPEDVTTHPRLAVHRRLHHR